MKVEPVNFGKTLVIQAFPGIGDMIWHLPYFRALADKTPTGKISILTKSRTMAKQWLCYDPIIESIFYAERRGLTQSIKWIREQQFHTVWVLHRSFSYALMAFLGGVPNRYGFGFGAQKYVLNRPPILEDSLRHYHTIDQVQTLFQRQGVAYDPSDQMICLPGSLKSEVETHFPSSGTSVAVGIGASEASKMWPLERYSELILLLNEQGIDTIYICGGPADHEKAQNLMDRIKSADGAAQIVTHTSIDQSIALMGQCDYYIGNDTGLLNAAACMGTPTIGLFGPTPALTYSPFIYPIKKTRMEDITTDDVMQVFRELEESRAQETG